MADPAARPGARKRRRVADEEGKEEEERTVRWKCFWMWELFIMHANSKSHTELKHSSSPPTPYI